MVGDPSRTSTQRKFSKLNWQTCLSASHEPKALFPALANRLACWGGDAGYRDRPLSFQWLSPPGLVVALGLPSARNAAHDATRSMIVAEALLGAQNGQGVSYSPRKVFYSIAKRYRAPTHTCATALPSFHELVHQACRYQRHA